MKTSFYFFLAMIFLVQFHCIYLCGSCTPGTMGLGYGPTNLDMAQFPLVVNYCGNKYSTLDIVCDRTTS
jgi:hypothetical protein